MVALVSVQVIVDGLEAVDAALARLQAAAEDPRGVLDEIADDFARANRKAFAGGRLVDTGRLRASLTSRPLGVERITSSGVELGTDVRYAIYHSRRLGIDAKSHEQAWRDRIEAHIAGAAQ